MTPNHWPRSARRDHPGEDLSISPALYREVCRQHAESGYGRPETLAPKLRVNSPGKRQSPRKYWQTNKANPDSRKESNGEPCGKLFARSHAKTDRIYKNRQRRAAKRLSPTEVRDRSGWSDPKDPQIGRAGRYQESAIRMIGPGHAWKVRPCVLQTACPRSTPPGDLTRSAGLSVSRSPKLSMGFPL